jgi:hypothetical protein
MRHSEGSGSTVAVRLKEGQAFEDLVAEKLRGEGFLVCRFGQAQIADDVRQALQATTSPLRWLADLLAVRGEQWFWVDPKTGRTDTDNNVIEQSAMNAHRAHGETYKIVIVWPDFGWNWAHDFTDSMLIPGRQIEPWRTPYYKIAKIHARPWGKLVALPVPVAPPVPPVEQRTLW